MRFLIHPALWFALSSLAIGKNIPLKSTPAEVRAIKSPPAKVRAIVDAMLPRVIDWYETVEAQFLPLGRPLSSRELVIAESLDVGEPGKIRVVILDQFPMPTDPELLREAKRLGFDNGNVVGRTNGNVIFLKPEASMDETVLAHECVHVGQIRRLGVRAFLREYVLELETVGYRRAPLELEAWSRQDIPFKHR